MSDYLVFNPAKYFLDHVGRDGKLAFSELKPIKLSKIVNLKEGETVPKGAHPISAYEGEAPYAYAIPNAARKTITQQEFNRAQNPQLDNDSSKLNYAEFSRLYRDLELEASSNLDFKDPQAQRRYCEVWDSSSDHLRDAKSEAILRTKVRDGLASAIQDTWSNYKTNISAAIASGKPQEVITQLSNYVSLVASMAANDNPQIDALCGIAWCVRDLYQLEELVSQESLTNSTIQNFWKEVNTLLVQVADQSVASNQLPKVKFYMSDDGSNTGSNSNFTLFALLEQAGYGATVSRLSQMPLQ